MKRTQRKDALRNIWKQKISFFSVIVIAFLGVTTFLGIDFTDAALRKNGSDAYNAADFRDIEILSTLLLTPEDLDAIRSTPGVRDAEAVWLTAGKVSSELLRQDVQVITLTERINRPRLLEGRLPAAANECAVEERLAREMGWQPGDTIAVTDSRGARLPYLTEERFLITGIADHPDHASTSIPDTPYILVRQDVFDMDALDGCFMKAEVLIDKPAGMNRFRKSYDTAVAEVLGRLEETGAVCALRRDGEFPEQLRSQINEGQIALDEAARQLSQARGQLDEGRQAWETGEQELSRGSRELSQGQQQLEESWEQLEDGRQKLNELEIQLLVAQRKLRDGKAELDAAESQLDEGREALESAWDALEGIKGGFRDSVRSTVERMLGGSSASLVNWAGAAPCQVDSEDTTAMYLYIANGQRIDLNLTLAENLSRALGIIPDSLLMRAYNAWCDYKGYTPVVTDPSVVRAMLGERAAARMGSFAGQYDQLRDLCQQWDAKHREYLQGLSAYNEGLRQYTDGLKKYEEGQKQFARGYESYTQGLAQYREAEAQLRQGSQDLEAARREWEDLGDKLDQGEQEYEKGLADFEAGARRLAEAREQLESLSPCRWICLDCRGNSSFVQLLLGSSNLSSLEMTFSMMFVLIGALVIFATVSKMIDEQRHLVGAGKALGLRNGEIFTKYLLYGVSGTLLGTLLGILTARFAMEPYILKTSAPFYTFDTSRPWLFPCPTLLALGAGLLLAVSATWFACTKLLRSSAIQLMQPKVPNGRKKAGRSKRGRSLYSRLILLNIRSDIRRVLVTVVSVAGCCALVVIGFTLKSGVEGALEKQYDRIVNYDGRIRFDTQADENAGREIQELLDRTGAEYTALYNGVVTFRVTENLVGELICGDIARISSFYHLLDWKTGEPLAPTDEGILIQKRTAESCGLDLGSELELAVGDSRWVKVRVAGIFDNYIGRVMFMSPACYRALMETDSRTNAFYIRLNGAEEAALQTQLRQIPGFESYTPSDTDKQLFASSAVLVRVIVVLFIFMAAVMAGVVLTNLTNVYYLQKKPELTIMRINGFTVREVTGYVVRETVITTVLGIVLGIALGAGVAYKITRAMESAFIQYNRSVNPLAWLYGAVITGCFAVVINTLVLRRIRDLRLTDMG